MVRTFNKPDLNAPRYKATRLNIANPKFYRDFIKKFPEYRNKLKPAELMNIVATCNINMREHAAANRDGTEFPEGLGYIFVGSCPKIVKKNNANTTLSIRYNQHIKHQNFESDSFVAKIFYTNYANRYKFKMRELWMFKGCRKFTRNVSKEYIKDWKRYVQVDSFMHIRKLFTKFSNRDMAIKFAAKPTSDYNEFELD